MARGIAIVGIVVGTLLAGPAGAGVPAPTAIVLVVQQDPLSLDNRVVFDARVLSVTGAVSAPGGDVTFFDDSVPIETVPLASDGTARSVRTDRAPGEHRFTAGYSGDQQHAPATSLPVVQVVQFTAAFMDHEYGSVFRARQLSFEELVLYRSTPSLVDLGLRSPGHRYGVRVEAPSGQVLQAGAYEDAERFASADHPGLSIYGDGLGCNTESGRFIVDEITFDAGDARVLRRFSARFEHHCGDKEDATFGAVSYRGTVPYRGRTLEPFLVAFGAQPRGTIQDATLTIRNEGPSRVTIGPMSLDGSHAEEFAISSDTCSGASLERGSGCTLDVRFLRSTMGPKSSEITFFDDLAPPEGTGRTVRLSGLSTARRLHQAPSSARSSTARWVNGWVRDGG